MPRWLAIHISGGSPYDCARARRARKALTNRSAAGQKNAGQKIETSYFLPCIFLSGASYPLLRM
jgi:hypothetical protein